LAELFFAPAFFAGAFAPFFAAATFTHLRPILLLALIRQSSFIQKVVWRSRGFDFLSVFLQQKSRKKFQSDFPLARKSKPGDSVRACRPRIFSPKISTPTLARHHPRLSAR
jgi:hypothetical protein